MFETKPHCQPAVRCPWEDTRLADYSHQHALKGVYVSLCSVLLCVFRHVPNPLSFVYRPLLELFPSLHFVSPCLGGHVCDGLPGCLPRTAEASDKRMKPLTVCPGFSRLVTRRKTATCLLNVPGLCRMRLKSVLVIKLVRGCCSD